VVDFFSFAFGGFGTDRGYREGGRNIVGGGAAGSGFDEVKTSRLRSEIWPALRRFDSRGGGGGTKER